MVFLNIKKAFTLIELMVAISVISILALWVTQIDFNRLNNKQKTEFFTNTIKSNIENVRNKALLGKWIWADLVVPKEWVMDFAKTWSWIIITKAFDWNWNILENIEFPMKTWFKIVSIKCWKYWEEEIDYNEMTYTWSIIFSWWDMKLITDSSDLCWIDESKILMLNINSINDFIKIKIDTLSWLIEVK